MFEKTIGASNVSIGETKPEMTWSWSMFRTKGGNLELQYLLQVTVQGRGRRARSGEDGELVQGEDGDLVQGAEEIAVAAAGGAVAQGGGQAVEDNDELGGMAASRPAVIARSSGAAEVQRRNGGPAAPQGGARGRRRGAASRPAVRERRSKARTRSRGGAEAFAVQRAAGGERGELGRGAAEQASAAHGAESSRRPASRALQWRSRSIRNTMGATVPDRIDVFADLASVVIADRSVASS